MQKGDFLICVHMPYTLFVNRFYKEQKNLIRNSVKYQRWVSFFKIAQPFQENVEFIRKHNILLYDGNLEKLCKDNSGANAQSDSYQISLYPT